MPEVIVPKVGMFQTYLPGELRLRAWPDAATPRADGYKRTRMGAGTYYPICPCSIGFGTAWTSMKYVPGFGPAVLVAGSGCPPTGGNRPCETEAA